MFAFTLQTYVLLWNSIGGLDKAEARDISLGHVGSKVTIPCILVQKDPPAEHL